MRGRIRCVLAVAVVFAANTLLAQEETFQLDPAKSSVHFTLAGNFHTVHGEFQLKSGVLRFDSRTGTASGELVVDASTGQSGNNSRDKKMKREVLEIEKFPTIVFMPDKEVGNVAVSGGSQVTLQGTMTLHGQQHPMTLVVPVQLNGPTATADVQFVVPYVQWGMKNPSTLFLRVSDKVDIEVHAVGTLNAQSAAAAVSH
jgi:polyisoprenoid-binding protein YceI